MLVAPEPEWLPTETRQLGRWAIAVCLSLPGLCWQKEGEGNQSPSLNLPLFYTSIHLKIPSSRPKPFFLPIGHFTKHFLAVKAFSFSRPTVASPVAYPQKHATGGFDKRQGQPQFSHCSRLLCARSQQDGHDGPNHGEFLSAFSSPASTARHRRRINKGSFNISWPAGA
jgi:hypothetical protein